MIIVIAAAAVGLVGVLGFVALTGGSDDPAVTPAVTTPGVSTPGAPIPSEPVASTPAEQPAATTAEPPATSAVPDTQPPAAGGTVETLATLPAPAAGLTLEGGDVVAVLDDSSVVRVSADGSVTALGAVTGSPGGVAVAPDGEVVVSTPAGVQRVADGTLLLDGAAVGLGSTPGPLAFDGVGNLYVADNDNGRVIRQATDGALSLVAGSGAAADGALVDGVAIDVALGPVTGLAVDGSGRLLIGDAGTAAVRAVTADGSITTVVGGGTTPVEPTVGPIDASPTDLDLGTVSGLGIDGGGGIAVTDDAQGLILMIASDGKVSVAIARSPSVTAPADGVPAGESTVGTIGPVGLERTGAIVFTDGDVLRRIAGS